MNGDPASGGTALRARAELRCSPMTQRLDVRPIGTAGSFEGLFVVGQPLPWPAKAEAIDELAALQGDLKAEMAAGRPHRLQLAVEPTAAPTRRISYYRRPEGLFDGYRRTRVTASPGEVVEQCRALLAEDAARPAHRGPTEVLLCTHGRRDICCGSAGTALHVALTRSGLPPNVTLERTSHLGGHRFAPTALILPSGTAWAWLDEPTFRGILMRTLPAERAVEHYRGCMGLDGPEVQAVDATLLAARGWSWLDTPRYGEVVARGDDRCEVAIWYVQRGVSGLRSLRVRLRSAGRHPVPVCGEPLDGSEAEQDAWDVVEVVDA